MKKRILSLILAALLCLSLLPASALAVDISPSDKLGFSIDGQTLQIFESDAISDGDDYRWDFTCTVTISDAVYALGSPDRLWYCYGDGLNAIAFIPLTNESGDTLSVEGTWANPAIGGETSLTVEMPVWIEKDAYAAAPAGTYTGTLTFLAYVWDETQNGFLVYEYATATLKLVIPGYNVTVSNPAGCTISVDKTGPVQAGETVHISYTPDEGYYLQELTVNRADGGVQNILWDAGAQQWYFTMPSVDVTVTGATIAPHTLTLTKPVLYSTLEGVELHADMTSPVRYGDTVTLSATFDPDKLENADYYYVESWEVKNPETGQRVELNSDGCSFSMPAFNVRAVPTIKYQDPNQGTAVVPQPDPGIAQDTDRYVVLYRNDGTDTLPQYVRLSTSGAGSGRYYIFLPSAPPFTHDGWSLLGWATAADSSTVSYSIGDYVDLSGISQGGSLVLYAVWEHETTYTLDLPESLSVDYGAESVTLPIEATALELGDGVSAIKIRSETAGIDFAEDPTFSSVGSLDAELVFTRKFWNDLSSGQQTVNFRYRVYAVDADGGDTFLGQYNIPLTIDVPEKYAVTVDDGITGGRIHLEKNPVYAPGDSVKVKIANDAGYSYDAGSLAVTYTDENGNTHIVETTGSTEKIRYFPMPAYPVTVTASFSPLVSAGNTEPETYALSGEQVLFFDTEYNELTEAAEGQTVTVSPDFDSIEAGWYFTGAYESGDVSVTVNEVGNGTFTMPAQDVTVDAVLSEQEDYAVALPDDTPVELPDELAEMLTGADCASYDETLEAWTLDVNGDGAADVMIDFSNGAFVRLPGADAVTGSATVALESMGFYRYNSVTITFSAAGPITITQQPADASAPLGEIVRTTVIAEGEGLTYQWYGREANGREFKSGLTGDTYSVRMVKSKIGRTVWCVITDANGNTTTTREAVLGVEYPEGYEAPAITTDAVDCFVDAGETASVTVAAEGFGELSYQWYFKNAGAETWSKSSIKSDTYACAMNGTRDGRQICCVVTDAWGNTARTATVTIGFDYPEGYEAPTVAVAEQNAAVDAGELATVTVTAEGEELTYQWYLKNPGAEKWSRSSLTGDTYSVTMVPAKSGRQVKCVVTDKYGKKAESETVTLTMVIPEGYEGPVITTQPADVTVPQGEYARTTVAAEGAGLTYQWYGREANGREFRSGLKTDTYSVKMVPSKSGRQVWCVVTDKYGNSVTSGAATLSMGETFVPAG